MRYFDDVSFSTDNAQIPSSSDQSVEPAAIDALIKRSDLGSIDEINERGGLFYHVDPISDDAIAYWSIVAGVAGLGAATSLLGVCCAVSRYWFDSNALTGVTMNQIMVYLQLIHLPMAVMIASTIVLVLLWQPPLLVRLGVALLIVMPGMIGCLTIHGWLSYYRVWEEYDGVPAMLMSFFVGASLPALATHMSTRWTLSHFQPGKRFSRATGIRSLMELTLVVALAYVLFRELPGGSMSISNGSFLLLGVFASITTLAGCFVFLRSGTSIASLLVGTFFMLVSAWGISFVCVLCCCVPNFGWSILHNEFTSLSAVALVGTLLVTTISVLSLLWMRFCGWRCQKG